MFDKHGTGTMDAEELRHVMLTLGEPLSRDEVRVFQSY